MTEIIRSEKYLRLVRQQECCCASFARPRCNGPIESHHHGRGGVALKASDLNTVPLCHAHHQEFHKRGWIAPFDRQVTELLFAEAMVRCLSAALLLGLKL